MRTLRLAKVKGCDSCHSASKCQTLTFYPRRLVLSSSLNCFSLKESVLFRVHLEIQKYNLCSDTNMLVTLDKAVTLQFLVYKMGTKMTSVT